MHLFSRRAPVKELDYDTDDIVQPNDVDLPPKAQRLLGANGRLGAGKMVNGSHNGRYKEPESFWRTRDKEHKSQARLPRSRDGDSDAISGAKRGGALSFAPMPMQSSNVPSSASGKSYGLFPYDSSATTLTTTQSSMESISREYYDPTKQPLSVSQQTSASAVRDMALRKGAPAVPTSPVSSRSTAKPLKSAMKRSTPGGSNAPNNAPPKKSKLDLMTLFPQPKSSGARILSPSNVTASPTVTTDTPPFSPLETRHLEVKRQPSTGRFEIQSAPKSPSTEGARRSAPRVIISEPDFYATKKTNVYRPPKGSKNWFDSFDISSGEEEDENEPVELPTSPAPAPAQLSVAQALPSVFSPYEPRRWEPTILDQSVSPKSAQDAPASNDTAHQTTKRRVQPKVSKSSLAADSASSGAMPERKQSTESRLTNSKLESQSVLSLSSESEDEQKRNPTIRSSVGNSTLILEKAASLEIQRPSAPARKLNKPHVLARELIFQQESAPQSPAPTSKTSPDAKSASLTDNRSPPTGMFDYTRSPRRQLDGMQGSAVQSTKSRQLVRSADGKEEDDIAVGESALTSVHSEASRMMAVTEEEMMLLELMRQKRAAMQKHSFTAGYRLALNEEQQNDSRKRESLQEPALMILKKKQRRAEGRRGRSRTESLLSDDIEQARRLSAIRNEDVDKSFKMRRFLAMEAPHLDKTSKMERFLAMAPGLADEYMGRPISGTEIEVESRYDEQDLADEDSESRSGGHRQMSYDSRLRHSSRDGTDKDVESGCDEEDEAESQFEDRHKRDEPPHDEVDDDKDEAQLETPTAQHMQSSSPMQRLTEKVCDYSSNGRSIEERRAAAAAEQYEKVRARLASIRVGESSNNTTPLASPNEYDTGENDVPPRYGILPSPVTDDEPYSPNLPAQGSSDRSMEQIPESELEEEHGEDDLVPHSVASSPRVKVYSAPRSSLKHPRPYRPSPTLDFTPLEIPATRIRSFASSTAASSPMTPTSGPNALSSQAGATTADSDNVNVPGVAKAAKVELSPALSSHHIVNQQLVKGSGRNPGTVTLSRIDTVGNKTVSRITSMSSITSAGSDVLAAWAELGGGRDALGFRQKEIRE